MKTDDFSFNLPEGLIAQHPCPVRGLSRLFVLDRGGVPDRHLAVADLPSLVEPGTVMVFNDSRVRKARIFGNAEDSGSQVEFLLLRPLPATAAGGAPVERWPAEGAPPAAGDASVSGSSPAVAGPGMPPALGAAVSARWSAVCSRAKRQRVGRTYSFAGGVRARVVAEEGDERIVEFDPPIGDAWLETAGHLPLPPYIRRDDDTEDEERYQTVYARVTGSSASPTAGLHFTPEILAKLDGRGIERRTVTLHVGLGTFLPVRTEQVEAHRMHEEWYTVPEYTAAAVNRARKEGRRVLAVGTTSLRTLESAWSADAGGVRAGPGATSIFIYPGYSFRAIDELFTNFHTPKSTLLMLVSAFAGRDRIISAYEEAVRRQYRFFSYGDAMLIR